MAAYDLVITNGIVVDGTGLPRRRADVAVKDGRIAAIGFVEASEGDRVHRRRRQGRGARDRRPPHPLRPAAHLRALRHVELLPRRDHRGDRQLRLLRGPARSRATPRGSSSSSPASRAWTPRPSRASPSTASRPSRSSSPRCGARSASTPPSTSATARCAATSWATRPRSGRPPPTRSTRWSPSCARPCRPARPASPPRTRPTHFDSADRPVPSRLSSLDELKALAEAAGRAGGGSLAYLPGSAVGGITPDDEELLIEMSLLSRMPVIIQGLGARSKVDAPTAGWDNAKRFVDEATARGAAVYSMAMSKPFNRTFDLAAGTKLYEGALQLNRLFTEASTRRRAPGADRRSRLPRRGARLGRPPQPRPGGRPHAAAAGVERAPRQQGHQAREREAHRPLARRHRRRARRAPHRRLPRHRGVRGPHRRVRVEDRDPRVDRRHEDRPGGPAHDRGHLRRRRPPRPRRRRRGPHLVPAALGAGVGRLHARGGRAPDHRHPRRAVRVHRPGPAPRRATRPTS